MIAEGIQKIEEMARADYLKTKIGDEVYSHKALKRIKRPDQQHPGCLEFNTLNGFADYIENNIDQIDQEKLCIHVESPYTVKLIGQLQPDNDNDRFIYAQAKNSLESFQFGRWLELELFIISLQSLFIETDKINEILTVLGNLASESIKENKDDGFTQVVQVKVGIALKREVELKNPITLTPYRTFREVIQPASNTILRIRQGRGDIECVLFEADGGAWKLDAIKNIHGWIDERLNGGLNGVMPVFA